MQIAQLQKVCLFLQHLLSFFFLREKEINDVLLAIF